MRNRVDGYEYAIKRSKLEVCTTDEALKRQWFQVRKTCSTALPTIFVSASCFIEACYEVLAYPGHQTIPLTFHWSMVRMQEIQAMAAAGVHQHIVRYYFAWLEEQNGKLHFYVQLEKCESSLGQRFSVERKAMKETELINILKQVGSLLQWPPDGDMSWESRVTRRVYKTNINSSYLDQTQV